MTERASHHHLPGQGTIPPPPPIPLEIIRTHLNNTFLRNILHKPGSGLCKMYIKELVLLLRLVKASKTRHS